MTIPSCIFYCMIYDYDHNFFILCFTLLNTEKRLECFKDGRLQVNNGIQCGRDVLGDQQFHGLDECATKLVSNGRGLDTSLGTDVSSEWISKKGNKEDHITVRSVSLSDFGNKGSHLNSGSPSMKEEVYLRNSLLVIP